MNLAQLDWSEQLAPIKFAYNNAINPSTILSSFQLDLSYHPRIPYTYIIPETEVVSASDFMDKLEFLQNQALDCSEITGQKQSEQVNKLRTRPRSFKTGDLFLLSTKFIRPSHMKTVGTAQTHSKHIGAFRVANEISATAHELDFLAHFSIRTVINIECLK
jgi:hypothetical protein